MISLYLIIQKKTYEVEELVYNTEIVCIYDLGAAKYIKVLSTQHLLKWGSSYIMMVILYKPPQSPHNGFSIFMDIHIY